MWFAALQFKNLPIWMLLVSFGFSYFPANRSLNVAAMDDIGIITDNTLGVETLVRDVFINGNCDNVENISSIGNSAGIGYFENGSTIIGMQSGIIISTGPIQNAEGANTATDISGNFADNTGDVDLGILATNNVRDAVGIEFDFVPLDSLVTFRYVFASEEYCEFVGSIFNDVFGFFISGPGIEGEFSNDSENVALIPGTDDYVAINSVNHIDNVAYYNRNELFEDAFHCEIEHVPSPYLNEFQYDGFTNILTAQVRLIPCETYHIRLVVSDVGDNFYDSAVFLEAESFKIGGAVGLSAVSSINPDNLVNEGCSDGYFLFQRLDQLTLNEELEVDILISDASTAESGVDFEAFPQTITIPAGELSTILPVETFDDGLEEPIESIIVELDIPCACYSDTAKLFLADSPELLLDLPDLVICSENGGQLVPQVEGGISGYSYQWSNDSTSSSVHVYPSSATAYYLTVTDFCGHVAVDSSMVSLFEPPTAALSGFAEICEGETANLSLELTGLGPWQVGYTVDGASPIVVDNILNNSYQLAVNQGGTYELFAVYDANCEGPTSGQAEVVMAVIEVDADVLDVSCVGMEDGAINVSISGGTSPYDLEWDQNLGGSRSLSELAEGFYTLSVTDADGCLKSVTIEIAAPNGLEEVRYDCDIFESGIFDFSATGGMPPYVYSIDGINFNNADLFESLVPGNTYQLWIQDANGCQLEQEFAMPNPDRDMFDLPESLRFKLGEVSPLEPMLNVAESSIVSARWTPSDYLSCSDCLYPEFTAITNISYSLELEDQFGCSDLKTMSIFVDPLAGVYIPSAFSPNGDGINDNFTIFASANQVQEIKSFRIFDRWGGLVFVNDNFPANVERYGWNGAANDKEMDPGVYVYFAEIELVDGNIIFEKGEVLLIR